MVGEIVLGNKTLDIACLIHGNYYAWDYVDILYQNIRNNLSCPIRFHVWTEKDRTVPPHMIKHALIEQYMDGPKKAWWYKTQLFNVKEYAGPMIYFDLDLMIIGDLNWMRKLPMEQFHAVRDFKCLWRKHRQAINSSIMAFDNRNFEHIWPKFRDNKDRLMHMYHGDQDYLNAEIIEHRRYLPENKIESYRWQVLHGGMDFRTRTYPQQQDIDVKIGDDTAIIVFHGDPKPHEVNNSKLQPYWRLDK